MAVASNKPSETGPTTERRIILAGLFGMCALAWLYVLYMGWGMEHMDAGADMAIMPGMAAWNGVDVFLVFAMWAVMMVAMMLPSATPMILVFAAVNQRRRAQSEPHVHPAAFVAGYIAIWTAFSGIAALAQWGLLEARLVSPMMASTSPALGGGLLICAGAYQFTPLKHACLSRCRSPLSFIMTEWRAGVGGAFIMGLRHGLYCTGCCWLLMALLFVVGVMNLLWIAALAAVILLEKTLPNVRWLSIAIGLLLIGWGIGVLRQAF
ncbi:putative metal-binding membrane protein [Paraburkholderia sp. GAS334]